MLRRGPTPRGDGGGCVREEKRKPGSAMGTCRLPGKPLLRVAGAVPLHRHCMRLLLSSAELLSILKCGCCELRGANVNRTEPAPPSSWGQCQCHSRWEQHTARGLLLISGRRVRLGVCTALSHILAMRLPAPGAGAGTGTGGCDRGTAHCRLLSRHVPTPTQETGPAAPGY